jgi:hypothetical protein
MKYSAFLILRYVSVSPSANPTIIKVSFVNGELFIGEKILRQTEYTGDGIKL